MSREMSSQSSQEKDIRWTIVSYLMQSFIWLTGPITKKIKEGAGQGALTLEMHYSSKETSQRQDFSNIILASSQWSWLSQDHLSSECHGIFRSKSQ